MPPASDVLDVLQRLHSVVFEQALPGPKSTAKNIPIPLTVWNQLRELAASAISQNHASATACLTQLDTLTSKIDNITQTIQAKLTTTNNSNTYATIVAKAGAVPVPPGTTTSRSRAVPRPKHVEITLEPKDPKRLAFMSSSPHDIVSRFNETMVDLGIHMESNKKHYLEARAAAKLRDGHIRLTLHSEDECDFENLADDPSPGWIEKFEPKLKLRARLFRVVVHGVDLREDLEPSLDADPEENWDTDFNALISLAKPLSGQDINTISRTKTHTSFVISTRNGHYANELITQRVSQAGRLLRTERFFPRLVQCFNCQRFGHFARQCKRSAVCGHCAGNHPSRKCTRSNDHACVDATQCHHPPLTCALCKGAHAASSRACPVRQDVAQKRAQVHSMTDPLYNSEKGSYEFQANR